MILKNKFHRHLLLNIKKHISSASAKEVIIDYNKLVNKNADLSKEISTAYGPDGLGISFVKNVPDFVKCRSTLLPLGKKLSEMPSEIQKKYMKPEAFYTVGLAKEAYKHGGKLDNSVSYWANPLYDIPAVQSYVKDGEVKKTAVHPNIWPTEDLPQLEPSFKNMGRLIFDVGCLLAFHIDKYVKNLVPEYEDNRISKVMKNCNGRLIHYNASVSTTDQEEDDWLFWHADFSELTGLTAPMYLDSDNNKINLQGGDSSGLEIIVKDGSVVKATIPEDCIAYQTGECLQIHTGGKLIATPHRVVRGKQLKGTGITRETFVLFFNPMYDEKMTIPKGTKREDVFVVKTDKIIPLKNRWTGNENYKDFNDTTWKYYSGSS